MFETWKLKAFDNLELVRSTAIQMDAPKHFHEGFAIGIATKGLQTMQLEKGDYTIPPGSLMFLNPRETHAHKQIPYSPWSHQMVYISPEYIFWLQKEGIITRKGELWFDAPIATSPEIYNNFLNFHRLLASGNTCPHTTLIFNETIAAIFNNWSITKGKEERPSLVGQVENIQNYLEQHYRTKLNLDELAARFKINKFQLIRDFKRSKGVTPNEYLNIIRIEAAKKYLAEGHSLVASAYMTGFYDQSHFSNYFLKYTCFTPGQFQRSCIA
ncbi:AraC family transcriptional regulator [Desertivirga brevis]|uniref:AraC family transcriptional regulator n=1 Tax=Desertivirga brevis TaxID=2810310 RepID=UPI001A96D602|nr:AraC family transcriptional regulator [Pedobacter sp. SYSU D00873]